MAQELRNLVIRPAGLATASASLAERAELGWYVLGFAALTLSVVVGLPAHLVYDENVFYPNIALLVRLGLNAEFLRALDQSPGPLYQLFHLAWAGVTSLEIQSMRLLNLACIGLSLPLLAGWASTMGLRPGAQWSIAGSILAIPPMWVISGLALTEAPAMFCLCASIFLLLRAMQHSGGVAPGPMAIPAGLLLSLAIIGRTPYLLVIPVAWALALDPGFKAWWTLAVFTVAALLLPVPIFLAWGGLTPPPVSAIQSGLNPLFGLYGFAYAGVFLALIAPGWFRWMPRAAAVAVAIAGLGAVANNLTPVLTFLPMATVAKQLLPPGVVLMIGRTFPALMVALGLYCLCLMSAQLWHARRDAVRLFLILCAIAIIATCAKSAAQFSSRYVAQAAPFLVFMAADASTTGTGRLIRLLGAALGLASLLSYYR